MTELPDDGYMTKAELLADLNIHHSTLWQWVRDGTFPPPVVLNPGAGREIVRWVRSAVRAWKDSRPVRPAKPVSEAAYAGRKRRRKPLKRPE